MAKNKISEFSSTPANNTDIANIDIAEGCAPSGINNAIRELMAQLKDQQTGTDLDNFTVGGNLVVAGTATGVTPAAADSSTKFATTEFLRTMYPIGVIYTSTAATNPATLFGFGTWVAFGAGKVLIGDGGGFTAGATGGSADATLVSHNHSATSTVSDPSHSHTASAGLTDIDQGRFGGGRSAIAQTLTTNSAVTGITVSTSIASAGSSATNANLQPYVVVYMWNRTA